MHLIFEQGDQDSPSGHALIYFQAEDGGVLATYVTVPAIPFDLKNYVPGFLAGAMQGMDMGDSMVAAPMPPIPEEVPSVDYLTALALRRKDDLVFAGATNRQDPMRLAADTAEAARGYGDLYQASALPEATAAQPIESEERDRFAEMSEQELLNELTMLTGRLRDSVAVGQPDETIERQMTQIGELLPAKYRVDDVIAAARTPDERGQKLAQLHLERCYKLFNEEYLDLERIDREIEAAAG